MFHIRPNSEDAFHVILGELLGLWLIANAGYYLIFYTFNFGLSYNTAPITIALYFLLWAGVSIFSFWDILREWLNVERRIWVYGLWSLGFAALMWVLLYLFAHLPAVSGLQVAPFTDILFATPWYFLPKSTEVLVQQILMTILVLELNYRYRSLYKVILGYIVCFGGSHLLLFLFFNPAATVYAAAMTIGSLFSALVFPYLILRVRGGFIYTYAIHLLFYIFLAMALHAWPPPGYIA
ncbi:MAG: hypothetical protein V4480_00525 [Patescibacteria group bacterium]